MPRLLSLRARGRWDGTMGWVPGSTQQQPWDEALCEGGYLGSTRKNVLGQRSLRLGGVSCQRNLAGVRLGGVTGGAGHWEWATCKACSCPGLNYANWEGTWCLVRRKTEAPGGLGQSRCRERLEQAPRCLQTATMSLFPSVQRALTLNPQALRLLEVFNDWHRKTSTEFKCSWNCQKIRTLTLYFFKCINQN